MAFDTAVIGGGPAGCAAAISVARAGASVLLLERGQFPRHKVCGEFVSAESLELLSSLLPNKFAPLLTAAPRISEARIFLDGVELEASVDPPAASIARFDLDCALWRASIEAGVTVHSGVTVRSVEGRGPFQIFAAEQVFESKSLINATGRWSNLTKSSAHSLTSTRKWIGIKAHFFEPSPSRSVDLYFFDGGYCGIQSVNSAHNSSGTLINACAMARCDVASTMPQILMQHPLLSERKNTWTAATQPVTTSPLIFHQPEPLQGEMLQVGDSAMFVDPFIGDGISLALRSGTLAAQSILPFLRGESSLEQVCSRYSCEYRQRFAHIFRASSRLRSLMRWPRAVRKPVLSVLAKAPFFTSRMVTMTR
ncbi:MAG TPA: FAD-dependent oxidoreductase [Terriglobales bacterium]|nr:FAD-dependent oxidoreductase [Terriglobales bacterium]